ncbi:hypothetical protein ACOSP7_009376 [Xanthoceras sorbifolium]
MKGYLAPYKGERYYLPEFHMSGQPTGSREMLNYMHSSLRSVIERCFSVWKARWRILQNMPNYKFDKQVAISIADVEFQSYDENQDYVSEDEELFVDLTIDESEMGVIRDRIARELLIR